MAREALVSNGRAKGTGKKKIEIKAIETEDQRYVTFSKRRQGLCKKADKYSSFKDFNFGVVIFSPTDRIFTHGNPSFGEVYDDYLKFIHEGAKNEDGRDVNEFVRSIQAIELEEYDDVEKLLVLKEKLQEIKEKAAKKIGIHIG